MTDSIQSYTQILKEGQNLSGEEAEAVAELLTRKEISAESKAEFLTILAKKGEQPEEVTGFARAFRKRALDSGLSDYAASAIDIVGTGGDHSGTFNFSTATALFIASQGIPVMKHGNRSITSRSGSADLLEALGVSLEASPEDLKRSMDEFNFCFFFAPAFHPAFREIMPVRKELAAHGIRTIFNLLGPLINPGKPQRQLLGVFSEEWVLPIANCLEQLDLVSAIVVHSKVTPKTGVDEWTVAGNNIAKGVGKLKCVDFAEDVAAYGLEPASLEELKGGDCSENFTLLHQLAKGDSNPALTATFLLNAGSALLICEKCSSVEEGIAIAQEALISGSFRRWLQRFQEFNQK